MTLGLTSPMALDKNYMDVIRERAKKSRVYQKHQSTGLALAEILEDREHKALYMRLAKKYREDDLIPLAKRVAENKTVKNKGAYFMRAFFGEGKAEKQSQQKDGTCARRNKQK